MFTGIIERMGTVRDVARSGDVLRLRIEDPTPRQGLRVGDSIAVDGVCLTAVDVGGGSFAVELSPETVARTTLGALGVGQRVHLEDALRLGDPLGGHIVQGHVDCVATLRRIEPTGECTVLRYGLPEEFARFLVEKGSVAVDGVSLTVNACGRNWFEVTIIPHTMRHTHLVDRGVGARVNIETDVLARQVVAWLERWAGNLLDRRHGTDG